MADIMLASEVLKIPPEKKFFELNLTNVGALKAYKLGTKYIRTKMTAHNHGGRVVKTIRAKDISIPISFGAPTPAQHPSGPDAKNSSIALSMNNCGVFGQAIERIDNEYLAEVAKNQAQLWTKTDKPMISSCIKRMYSEECKKKELSGKPRDVPIISLKVHFDKYPAAFGALGGQPKTIVYNYASRRIVGKQSVYDEATDDKGAKLNKDNACLILSSQTIIKQIDVTFETVCIHKQGISLAADVSKIWIENGNSDENVIGEEHEKAPISEPPLQHNDNSSEHDNTDPEEIVDDMDLVEASMSQLSAKVEQKTETKVEQKAEPIITKPPEPIITKVETPAKETKKPRGTKK